MRTFKTFPKESVCPICQTNENKECFLIAIDGTEEDGLVAAKPTHTECLMSGRYRINESVGIIYRFIK